MTFSFIDHGLRDFIRTDDGKVLYKEFSSWDQAENFVADGGLDEFGWTNQGTQKYCWNDEED